MEMENRKLDTQLKMNIFQNPWGYQAAREDPGHPLKADMKRRMDKIRIPLSGFCNTLP